jgi:phosphate uptake regulator
MEKSLEYRKIQRVGRGSYTLTLPREWIEKIGLEKGNHVAVMTQEDSSLLLVPRSILEGRKEEKEPYRKEYRIFVDTKSDPQSVCRMVTSLYAVSADLIHVRFKDGEIPTEYKTAMSYLSKNLLLGSEIINETANEITIQILINHPDFPVEQAIRRMAILALSANREAICALGKDGGNFVETVSQACNDVERLNLYVIRQLKYGLERNLFDRLGFKSPKEFLGYRIVVNDVKSVADNALNLANNIAALEKMMKDQMLFVNESFDEEIWSQILEFNSKAHSFFEETLKALFKRDYDGANNQISETQRLAALENELIMNLSTKKMDPNLSSIFRLILDSTRRIIEYGRNIAEVTLNRTVEEKSQLI